MATKTIASMKYGHSVETELNAEASREDYSKVTYYIPGENAEQAMMKTYWPAARRLPASYQRMMDTGL